MTVSAPPIERACVRVGNIFGLVLKRLRLLLPPVPRQNLIRAENGATPFRDNLKK